MKICRYSYDDQVLFGVVGAQGCTEVVLPLDGHPFGPLTPAPGASPVPLAQVKLLAPTLPSKVIGVGRNYAEHAREFGAQVPDTPLLFLKPSTAVIGPGEPILLPEISRQVDHEAELAVVIGRMCKQIAPEQAVDVIAGYTCANDVTARDLQRQDEQWARAKGMDTFAPLGPWMVQPGDLDLENSPLQITCSVNGQPRQRGSSEQMVYSVAHLVSHISQAFTLLPGDVILTGTPAGVGQLHPGDEVSVEISGIGTLTNPVLDPCQPNPASRQPRVYE